MSVTHRNAFMGLTRHRELRHGLRRRRDPGHERRGQGGHRPEDRADHPEHRPAGAARDLRERQKYCLKIVREWGNERVQWGIPVGKHDAVAQKIATIAGTAFGLEAMLDVSSRLADEKRNDIRIEAALAKLYGSEMGWLAVDEMMQVRGGRGYETAESLKARGEKPVPAEQLLRDMRINRIFEGSTEIMHLLIAREAVDQHLQVAGDIIEPDVPFGDKAKTAVKAGEFYADLAAEARGRQGHEPDVVRGVRRPGRAPALRRAQLPQARPLDVLRDESLAGEAGEEAVVPRPDRRHRRRALRDRLRLRLRPDAAPRGPGERRAVRRARRLCSATRPGDGSTGCCTTCGSTTTTRTTPRR